MSSPRKGFPLLIEDCETVPLKNPNQWSLQGYSRSGERTSFRVKPINIALDAGLVSLCSPNALFLTHSHVDHTWSLPSVSGGIKANTRQTVIETYFPAQAYKGLTKLLEAATILSYPKQQFTEQEFWSRHLLSPHPVNPGDKFYVNNIKVEVLQAVHSVHSVGYGFSTKKSVLKKEYKNLTSKELIELKSTGNSISEIVEQPEFVFFCDSTIQNLLNYDEWKKYPSVVVECTGYPEIYERNLVHERGHTHMDDLINVLMSNKDKNWFLIHSTMKADKEFLENKQSELKDLNIQILSKY